MFNFLILSAMHGTALQITGNRSVDVNPNSIINSDRKQYFLSLLAAKFNRQDLGSIAKAWGRSAGDARQDFIHIQKLYDGMVMYMERYVEAKIP